MFSWKLFIKRTLFILFILILLDIGWIFAVKAWRGWVWPRQHEYQKQREWAIGQSLLLTNLVENKEAEAAQAFIDTFDQNIKKSEKFTYLKDESAHIIEQSSLWLTTTLSNKSISVQEVEKLKEEYVAYASLLTLCSNQAWHPRCW